jgi:hypothetical protein
MGNQQETNGILIFLMRVIITQSFDIDYINQYQVGSSETTRDAPIFPILGEDIVQSLMKVKE